MATVDSRRRAQGTVAERGAVGQRGRGTGGGRRRRGVPGRIVLYVMMAGYAVWSLLPVLWVLLSSFKQDVDVLSVPPKLLFTPTLDNYPAVLDTVFEFPQVVVNSIVIAGAGTASIIALSVPAAYGLNRLTRIRRGRLGLTIVSARMFPTIALAIPLYLMMQNANLLDTRFSVIIANVAFSLPFAIWMIYGFLDTIPYEIEEAAALDGCSRLRILLRVVVPQIMPGIAATAILVSIVAWREFLFPLLLTTSDARTLPVVVSDFITGQGIAWGQLCAFAVITIVPVAAFSLFVGKYLVVGFSGGGVRQ